MCGIAVILSKDLESQSSFIERAHKLLHHRGPDSSGTWRDGTIGMVHKRLSIQDLSEAGNQPMVSNDENYILIFNGEIYNHLELRKRFLPDYKWRGHSDTETIIALFQLLKEDTFQHFVGMWAIAIWDRKSEKLIISRDRYGQKPLYFRFKEGQILISSEKKPLLIPGESNKGNSLMIAEYLALGNYGHLGDQTFFRDIYQLLPGTFAWVTRESTHINPISFWKIPYVPPKGRVDVGKKELVALEEVIVTAVESQTISDVPIGASLSGGLDSSLIVGILASNRSINNPISVFTAQTPKSKWDESIYVNEVINKWGKKVNLFKRDLDKVRISEHLESTISIQEEPFGDPSIIAHGFLMDMASELGVKVVLGGQGADELFRGYQQNIKQLFSYEMRRFNLNYILPELKNANYSISENIRIGLGAFAPAIEKYLRQKSRIKRRYFLSEHLKQDAIQNPTVLNLAHANNWEEGLSESIKGVHIPHLVHYDDRNGMARSIEGRMPFLDHRILDLVSTFNPNNFFQDGYSKVLLRKIGGPYLPEKIINRKDKLGFFTPLHEILLAEIKLIEELLKDSPWVNPSIIEDDLNLLKNRKGGGLVSERIWRVISITYWSRIFNVTL